MKENIKDLLNKLKNLNLTAHQKKRMLRLFQVRGTNNINRTLTYKEFVLLVNEKNAKITEFVIGPKWNRLIFVDLNVEI